ASFTIWLRTWLGVNDGLAARMRAAPPATCGDAIEVPLMVLVAELLVNQADVIDTPGAKMSRQEPQLENDARWSLICVAPTVIAAGTSAGEKLHALELLLPAAIAYVTPALIELATALFMVVLTPAPPRLMFATAGLMWLLVTQLMPATICEVVPLPL